MACRLGCPFFVSVARERLCARPPHPSFSKSIQSKAPSVALARPLAYTRPLSSASFGNLRIRTAGQSIRPLATVPAARRDTTSYKSEPDDQLPLRQDTPTTSTTRTPRNLHH